MRAVPTDAEKHMWYILRCKRLAGYRFRRQRPIAGYIVDFYCASRKLIIELDGGQHSEADQLVYDQIRTAKLEKLGLRVLRFWDTEVLKNPDGIKETIFRYLEHLPPP
jgi:very-short-patch-repair endonuclease